MRIENIYISLFLRLLKTFTALISYKKLEKHEQNNI